MPKKIDRKKIKAKALIINDAWQEGAPSAEFMGIKQSEYQNAITEIENKENTYRDLKAQLTLLDTDIENRYGDLDDNTVGVANGVRGSKDYGDDSALYGAMGYVRASERKSGLTHKKK